jgi:hypothetical protein
VGILTLLFVYATPVAALQFTLVAQASAAGPGRDSNCTVMIEVKARYSYITCARCGDIRLPKPPEQPHTSSEVDGEHNTGRDAHSAAPTSPAAAAAAAAAASRKAALAGMFAARRRSADAAAAAGRVSAGEPVCPVHLQVVYRLTIAPHTDGQANSLTKVNMWQVAGTAADKVPTHSNAPIAGASWWAFIAQMHPVALQHCQEDTW